MKTLDTVINEVKDLNEEPCVTVILNTHRTKPDNQQDEIKLKNKVKEAIERLYAQFDKRTVWPVEEKLNKLTEEINHFKNLDSLVLMASPSYSGFVRLPVQVQGRVVIDRNFATRDLIRAKQQEARYYVLTLGQNKARLIEMQNDKPVGEINNDDFPMENETLKPVNRLQDSMSATNDKLVKEFFNRVDKALLKLYRPTPLPVIVASDNRNFEFFKEVADIPKMIYGHITGSRDDQAVTQLVKDTYEAFTKIREENRMKKIEELKSAQSQQMLISDLGDILRQVENGRVQALYVEEGYHQPAKVEGQAVTPLKSANGEPNEMDDIVDEIIEQALTKGSEIKFLPDGALSDYHRIAATMRY